LASLPQAPRTNRKPNNTAMGVRRVNRVMAQPTICRHQRIFEIHS
jgi:hypothetical protein